MAQLESLGYLIGAGSFTLGIEQAGFKVNEIWETPGYGKNAQSWELNRPDLPVYIKELDHESRHFAPYQGLDLIYGNPPCGGLSAMTCSRMSSPTNNCMRQWIRMVVHARPRMILMENAYQLATDRIRPLLDDLTGVLEAADYYWWTWKFYSYQIGCPQIRRRMFLCATRDKPLKPHLVSLKELPQDRENAPIWPYLHDLEHVAPSPTEVTLPSGAITDQHWYGARDMPRFLEAMRYAGENRDKLKRGFLSDRDVEKAYERIAMGGEEARVAQDYLDKNLHRYVPGVPKDLTGMMMMRPQYLNKDLPMPALIGFYKYVHPTQPRFLTMREMARLMGYPDSWNFHQLNPALIAQGIPTFNAKWASARLYQILTGKEIGE